MAYFRCGGNGNTIMIDGQEYDDDINLKTIGGLYKFYKDFPDTDNHRILVNDMDGKLHAFGGSKYHRRHYIYNNDDDTWSTGNELPGDLDSAYNNRHGDVVLCYGQLYALGCYNQVADQENLSYRLLYASSTGDSWERRADMPYSGYGCAFVSAENTSIFPPTFEIHMLGGNTAESTYYNHYKYDVTSNTWKKVGTLPYRFVNGSAVYLNGEIHILGSSYNVSGAILNSTKHYKYNLANGNWVKVSELPYDFCGGKAIVINGEIHIFGGKHGEDNVYNGTKHYKYSNGDWVNVGDIPFVLDGCACYHGEMHYSGVVLTADYRMGGIQSKCYNLICSGVFMKGALI